MQSFTRLLPLSLFCMSFFAAATSAFPQPERKALALRQGFPPAFYLRTCLSPTNTTGNGTTPPDYSKDGLYIDSYHTGAGLSDATLSSDKSIAAEANLTNGCLLLNFRTTFPWGMYIDGDTNYAGKSDWCHVELVRTLLTESKITAWDPVQIDTGKRTCDFVLTDGKLIWDNPGFYGWFGKL